METDHFVLDVSEVGRQARSLSPTKRNIVSLVGGIYDPLGFLSPVLNCPEYVPCCIYRVIAYTTAIGHFIAPNKLLVNRFS